MSWSLTEFSALAGKAARGAGAPPLQAARFGQAAACHLLAGRDAAELLSALDAAPDGPIAQYPRLLDARLAEISAGRPGAALKDVPHTPLLDSYVAQLPFAAELGTSASGDIVLIVDFETPRARAEHGRISDHPALIARMEALAAKTYVPDSEASRRMGAGAGSTDND